jgi:hypothetical protein
VSDVDAPVKKPRAAETFAHATEGRYFYNVRAGESKKTLTDESDGRRAPRARPSRGPKFYIR